MDKDNLRFTAPLRTAPLDTPEGEHETAELMEMGALPDPFQRIAELEKAFEAQFRPLPDGKVPGGHLEVGEYDGGCYAYETDVEFRLGPDDNVWAKIGTLDDIPDEQPADEDDGDEHGSPPVIVAHRGITVYHCWHDECLSENWYTTNPDDADIDHGGDAQFDVRDLPDAPPIGDDGRADHRGRIIAAIDAGLITEDGYANPDDLAEEVT